MATRTHAFPSIVLSNELFDNSTGDDLSITINVGLVLTECSGLEDEQWTFGWGVQSGLLIRCAGPLGSGRSSAVGLREAVFDSWCTTAIGANTSYTFPANGSSHTEIVWNKQATLDFPALSNASVFEVFGFGYVNADTSITPASFTVNPYIVVTYDGSAPSGADAAAAAITPWYFAQ
jgi:hypothetical protein